MQSRLLRVKIKLSPVHLVEPPQQIFGRSVDVVATRVVGEVIPQRRSTELLFEEIDLVEEQNDAGSHKPSRIDDRIEEDQTFHHAILHWCQNPWFHFLGCCAYLIGFFQKDLIVFTQRHTEDDGRNIFETVDPFLAFTSLTTHVKHTDNR